jgi:hypothetical protein
MTLSVETVLAGITLSYPDDPKGLTGHEGPKEKYPLT